MKAKHQTQLYIRDASQDRQSEIHSTPVREYFHDSVENYADLFAIVLRNDDMGFMTPTRVVEYRQERGC